MRCPGSLRHARSRVFRIVHLEIMLVPLALGIWAPLVWKYVSNGDQNICHISPQYIGPMLIHLPGAQVDPSAL